jgi:hypothetical protein
MLLPPLTLQDLSILLAVSAILLLVTAELVPYVSGEKTLISEVKKLRNLAIVLGVLFLVTVAITILNIILNLQL